eukprot:6516555-Pyramimonas_sp.AAC.2
MFQSRGFHSPRHRYNIYKVTTHGKVLLFIYLFITYWIGYVPARGRFPPLPPPTSSPLRSTPRACVSASPPARTPLGAPMQTTGGPTPPLRRGAKERRQGLVSIKATCARVSVQATCVRVSVKAYVRVSVKACVR